MSDLTAWRRGAQPIRQVSEKSHSLTQRVSGFVSSDNLCRQMVDRQKVPENCLLDSIAGNPKGARFQVLACAMAGQLHCISPSDDLRRANRRQCYQQLVFGQPYLNGSLLILKYGNF